MWQSRGRTALFKYTSEQKCYIKVQIGVWLDLSNTVIRIIIIREQRLAKSLILAAVTQPQAFNAARLMKMKYWPQNTKCLFLFFFCWFPKWSVFKFVLHVQYLHPLLSVMHRADRWFAVPSKQLEQRLALLLVPQLSQDKLLRRASKPASLA